MERRSRGEGAELPVAGEARLVADVEPLAEQTHPLDAGRSLQLPQAAVPGFTFVHLRRDRRTRDGDVKEEPGAAVEGGGGYPPRSR